VQLHECLAEAKEITSPECQTVCDDVMHAFVCMP